MCSTKKKRKKKKNQSNEGERNIRHSKRKKKEIEFLIVFLNKTKIEKKRNRIKYAYVVNEIRRKKKVEEKKSNINRIVWWTVTARARERASVCETVEIIVHRTDKKKKKEHKNKI